MLEHARVLKGRWKNHFYEMKGGVGMLPQWSLKNLKKQRRRDRVMNDLCWCRNLLVRLFHDVTSLHPLSFHRFCILEQSSIRNDLFCAARGYTLRTCAQTTPPILYKCLPMHATVVVQCEKAHNLPLRCTTGEKQIPRCPCTPLLTVEIFLKKPALQMLLVRRQWVYERAGANYS